MFILIISVIQAVNYEIWLLECDFHIYIYSLIHCNYHLLLQKNQNVQVAPSQNSERYQDTTYTIEFTLPKQCCASSTSTYNINLQKLLLMCKYMVELRENHAYVSVYMYFT